MKHRCANVLFLSASVMLLATACGDDNKSTCNVNCNFLCYPGTVECSGGAILECRQDSCHCEYWDHVHYCEVTEICAENGIRNDAKCVDYACVDGVMNGDETDLDCGGSCSWCEPGATCHQPEDCASGVCSGGACE